MWSLIKLILICAVIYYALTIYVLAAGATL